MKVEGIDDVNAKLVQLEKRVAKQCIQKSLRAGAKIVQRQAIANVPVGTGNLKKSIKVRVGRRRKDGVVSIKVVTAEWTMPQLTSYKKHYYGAFVEFGHKQGSRKLGDNRKDIEGKHFMENAYLSQKEAATAVIGQVLAREVDKAVTEIGKGK